MATYLLGLGAPPADPQHSTDLSPHHRTSPRNRTAFRNCSADSVAIPERFFSKNFTNPKITVCLACASGIFMIGLILCYSKRSLRRLLSVKGFRGINACYTLLIFVITGDYCTGSPMHGRPAGRTGCRCTGRGYGGRLSPFCRSA